MKSTVVKLKDGSVTIRITKSGRAADKSRYDWDPSKPHGERIVDRTLESPDEFVEIIWYDPKHPDEFITSTVRKTRVDGQVGSEDSDYKCWKPSVKHKGRYELTNRRCLTDNYIGTGKNPAPARPRAPQVPPPKALRKPAPKRDLNWNKNIKRSWEE